jgi:hypothetical protein
VYDLAFHVDQERRAIRQTHVLNQYPVLLGNITHVVGKEWNVGLQIFGEPLERRSEIGTNAVDLRVCFSELRDTSLVRGEFLRSATCECGREKRQHDVLLAA